MSDTVKLKGISQHGKNRVREQGEVWRVITQSDSLSTTKHRSSPGPFLLLRAGDNIRWVSLKQDPDFEVVS